jgi:hypothetical protein
MNKQIQGSRVGRRRQPERFIARLMRFLQRSFPLKVRHLQTLGVGAVFLTLAGPAFSPSVGAAQPESGGAERFGREWLAGDFQIEPFFPEETMP